MTGAILAHGFEGKGPDPVAGRSGSDAPETVGTAPADISGVALRSGSVYSLRLVPGPRVELAAFARRFTIAERRAPPLHTDWKPGGSDP
jgi:hypothetical protein